MSKAIISLTEHLGDIVAAEPVARHLKRKGHHVTWVTFPRYKALVADNPDVDQVLTVECLSEWACLFPQRDYDLVADLHFDQRLCHVTQRPQTKRFGDKSVSLENYLNHGSLLGAFCASAGLPVLSDAPTLHVKPGPAAMDKPYAVMHCLPNEREREWPVMSWRMLAYDLAIAGLPVVEIGERGVLDGMRGVVDRTGTLSVSELAGVIRHARIFVGCESGPAHIANALRVESLVLMGQYRGRKSYDVHTGFFREPGNRALLRTPGPLNALPYPVVRSALMCRLLPKSP